MTGTLVAPLVRKEARALTAIWLASAVPLALAAAAANGLLLAWALAAYALGATTLGAVSVGHEYSHQTLPQLLALPADRHHLLRVKSAVLVLALLTLGLVAVLTVLRFFTADPMMSVLVRTPMLWTVLLLPLVTALTLTPWLTMLCRSPIAGVVFTLAAPAALWGAAQAANGLRDSMDDEAARWVTLATLWTGTVVVAGVSALLSRRTFLNLEALGSHGEYDATEWLRRPARADAGPGRRSRSPFGSLVQKELRLQSVAFVVAALYMLAWVVLWSASSRSSLAGATLGAMTYLYTGVISAIVGALASAEERALGTLEWQVLQPYACWKQWLLKCVTAVCLVVVLAVVLPLLLEYVMPAIGESGLLAVRLGGGETSMQLGTTAPLQAILIVTLFAGSLYVSSFCKGGLQALLMALPIVATAAAAVMLVVPKVSRAFWDVLSLDDIVRTAFIRKIANPPVDPLWSDAVITLWGPEALAWQRLVLMLASAMVVLLLRFAFVNHRSADRVPARIRRQLAWIAAYVLVSAILIGALSPVALWLLASD